MILFLAFMVGFFSGYNEYTRSVALDVLYAACCLTVIGGIVGAFLIMFSEVKPAVQGMMAIAAVLGVFAIIASAYDSYRKEKLLKLQEDLECERCERGLKFWKDKT